MPSKRDSTAAHSTHEPGPETKVPAPRPARSPRSSRGAAVIPPPRKSELGLHRVTLAPRPLPTRDQIAVRAYEIWEQSGRLPGRDGENWAQAERELSTGC